MIDINALISNAIIAAVSNTASEVRKQYTLEIEKLTERVLSLEKKLGEVSIQEQNVQTASLDKVVTYLDSQEWFWAKVSEFVTVQVMAQTEDYVQKFELEEQVRESVDYAVEAAMDDHTSTYDHDEYDRIVCAIDNEEFITKDDFSNEIENQVQEVLSNCKVSIKI